MNLDNFYLAKYDNGNIDHKTVVVELYNDRNAKQYLGDLEYQVQMIQKRREEDIHNTAYIAYYAEDPVGYISFTYKDDSYQISYGIRPKFRGEHLGALLLQEFSEKMFEVYPEVDTLTLMIHNLNTGSKKTASLAGFTQENSTRHVQHRV